MKFTFKINQPKTWFIDLDGSIVKHNGHLNGTDEFLIGAKEFLLSIDSTDFVIITTARSSKYKKETINFLKKHKIKFNKIIFDLPTGERILINDKKPDGTKTAYSLNLNRDSKLNININKK
jgi:hypothetical protein